MPTNSKDEIGRRTYLKFAGGAAAAVSLAGCTDTDDIETDTPVDGNGNGNGNGNGDDTDTETPEDQEPLDITITQGQMVTTLDPHDHRETSTDNVLFQAYQRIITRDREGRVIANIATDWSRIDNTTVRYEIQEGISFHNGETLTPADCAYSINRVVDPDVSIESPQADQLAGITGAEVVDGEVHVTSGSLNPMIFGNQASYCPVVNEEWVESRDSNEVSQDINGTGPYQLVEYEEDVEVIFERFDDYWSDTPDVEGITYRSSTESSARVSALRAGETDVIVNVPPQDAPSIQDNEGTTISAVPSTRVLFLVMNDVKEPFDNQEFRQAMNYAIDLDSMIENILDGFGDPTGQPTLEGYVGEAQDVEPYPYEPDTAEDLVDSSGHAGVEIDLHTPVGRYLGDVNMAQTAAGYIDDLSNVSCDVTQRDFGSLAGELLDGDQETSPAFFLIGWGNTTFDASQTLIPWLTPGAINHFTDDEISDLLDQAQDEADEDVRADLLADVNRRAHDLATWVFLHRQYSVYGHSERIDWEPRQDEYILVEEMNRA